MTLNEIFGLSRRKKDEKRQKQERREYLVNLINEAKLPTNRELMYTFFSGKFDIWSEKSLAWLGIDAAETSMAFNPVSLVSRALKLGDKEYKCEYNELGVWIYIDDVLGVALRIEPTGIYTDG